MELVGKTIVVTGGASGIGRALARRFATEGAAHIAVADLDGPGAEAVAHEIGGSGHLLDVTDAAAMEALIDQVENGHGPIDLFCSNAGIALPGGLDGLDADWDRVMDVNVKSHVHVARVLVPRMIERGGGYLLNTASAAGLLAQVGSITYSVSKHAAVALAEWLSITHGADGIKVSVLCPQAVNTPMISGTDGGGVAGLDGVMEPDELAQVVVDGLAAERFHILPHPEVAEYVRRKADDVDRWLGGMQRMNSRFQGGVG